MTKRDTIAIAGIQARMGSRRLPGKSLADLGGEPLVHRVWERARRAARVAEVFVLTSTDPADDPLFETCEQLGIPVRRGPEDDVLARYTSLVAEYGAHPPPYIVRITGDCPLVSPEYVDLQLDALERFDGDFAVPAGGVEAVPLAGQGALSTRALLSVPPDDPRDREHVGAFHFAAHRGAYRTVELDLDPLLLASNLRLCVDEEHDLTFLRRVWDDLALAFDPGARLVDVVRYVLEHPELREIHAGVRESSDNRDARALRAANPPAVVGRWP